MSKIERKEIMKKITNELTKRDVDLIICLKKGMSYNQTAINLKIPLKKVYGYMGDLRKKTNCLTNTALVYKFDKKEIYEVSPKLTTLKLNEMDPKLVEKIKAEITFYALSLAQHGYSRAYTCALISNNSEYSKGLIADILRTSKDYEQQKRNNQHDPTKSI